MGTYSNQKQETCKGSFLKRESRVSYKNKRVNFDLLQQDKIYNVIKYEWDDSEGWNYKSYEIIGEYPELEKNNKKEMKIIEKINEIPNATKAKTFTQSNNEKIVNDNVILIYNSYILPSMKKGDYSVTIINNDDDRVVGKIVHHFERMDLIKKVFENKGYKCEYGTSNDGRNGTYENRDILVISWK